MRGYGSLVTGQQIARTTSYRVRRVSAMTLYVIGLVLAIVDISGAADVPTHASLMLLALALALSPVQVAGANSPPPHLVRWVRLMRTVQVACLVVGFALGAVQLLGTERYGVQLLIDGLFLVSILLTTVFMATTWPAPRAEPQR